ncbi:hypothetical protein CP49_16470 [Bradyrhizobium valentinum]|uniref:Uncharacterized protein n=1 Tax=Bradyrhizobium valentinum TaxID=1518501 RepID=A0A0R3KA77_9BRAD|nr:hypothetical protein CP49_16470 [Bradyrhizobium valentinum]
MLLGTTQGQLCNQLKFLYSICTYFRLPGLEVNLRPLTPGGLSAECPISHGTCVGFDLKSSAWDSAKPITSCGLSNKRFPQSHKYSPADCLLLAAEMIFEEFMPDDVPTQRPRRNGGERTSANANSIVVNWLS